jgi:lysozyme
MAKSLQPGAQINSQGLALLQQYEPIPSYAEQSLREIERAVWRQVQVPLNPNQFAALVSWTYSIGEAIFRRSLLLQHLNAGRYQSAAEFFTHPNPGGPEHHLKHQLQRQLQQRRAAERKLFLYQ